MHDLRDTVMLNYIQENIDSDLKLSDVARQFHMSPSYLSRYFKQTYGVNFLEYVTKLRLEGVCRDLMLWPGTRGLARCAGSLSSQMQCVGAYTLGEKLE